MEVIKIENILEEINKFHKHNSKSNSNSPKKFEKSKSTHTSTILAHNFISVFAQSIKTKLYFLNQNINEIISKAIERKNDNVADKYLTILLLSLHKESLVSGKNS